MNKFKEWLIIKGYSSKSVETIIKATEYFARWSEQENITDPCETSHNDITGFIHHYNIKGTGKKTIAHYIMHVKKYFDWMITEGSIEDNPCSNIKIKGIRRKTLHEILSGEELENLYTQYATENSLQKYDHLKNPPPQHLQNLARQRNKIIIGLLVYQGIRSEEITRLQLSDVKLREGKIFIAGAKRSNERTLKLQPHQVFDLLDYINSTRKEILHYKGITQPNQDLFLNIGSSEAFANTLSMLLRHLKQLNVKVKSLDQLRASVLVQWLKLYNLRKVQIMAGHRYISSTESYRINNLEDLKEDIKNYHPLS